MKRLILLLFIFTSISNHLKAQTYFPPISQSAFWDTSSIEDLGWCRDKLDSLYSYLEDENSKGFMVLKDGKIVIEKYFGSFTKDSLWYWASAGKTITSLLVGIAQEEGYLDIDSPTSNYLGANWTSCTSIQEEKIKVRNQLNMTSGLDDGGDVYCTIDTCLEYLADAGSRWAYHNAPYTLLEEVISNASSLTINNYTQTRLKSKIGMNGLWLKVGYNNLYFSNVRSMARFGLLIQNDCVWDTDSVLKDQAYINQMTTTSQSINLSYGHLWWLNGKSSFMLPGLQTVFPGSYAPNAPSDMYAGIGKDGQIVSISDSEGLVVVRMGNEPSVFGAVPVALIDGIWEHLNAVRCTTASVSNHNKQLINVYPNPSKGRLIIQADLSKGSQIQLLNSQGQLVKSLEIHENSSELSIDFSSDINNSGLYFLRIISDAGIFSKRLYLQGN